MPDASTWLVRLYDGHIRTNYVEGRFKARDRMEALDTARSSLDFTEQCTRRFRYISGFDEAVKTRNYEIIHLPDVQTVMPK